MVVLVSSNRATLYCNKGGVAAAFNTQNYAPLIIVHEMSKWLKERERVINFDQIRYVIYYPSTVES